MITFTYKTLLELLNIDSNQVINDFSLNQLNLNSQSINIGDVFVAIKGTSIDGRDFISQAISKGAIVILAETDDMTKDRFIDKVSYRQNTIPVIYIYQLAQKLSSIANSFYHHPDKQLALIGVTGTNGKTTITQLIAQAARLLHQKSAVIGTIGNGIYPNLSTSINTTPSAVEIAKLLTEFNHQKVDLVAMEISSHGLVMDRVKGLSFQATVFSNLTQDHLDYHKTMDNYAKAKWSLFSNNQSEKNVVNSGISIINYDDELGKKWLEKLPHAIAVSNNQEVLNQLKNLNRRYLGITEVNYHAKGATISLDTSWGKTIIHSQLLGEFNVSNLLLAIATLLSLNFQFDDLIQIASQLKPICGRMEIYHVDNGPSVIIDYAHTPDALEKALQACKIHCQGKLWVIFGCGGDRDKSKRPLMGKVAEALADNLILTNDNPRTEDDMDIICDITQGLSQATKHQIIKDRAQAIQFALTEANQHDVILIAGKGHEDYQIIGKTKHPYSDQETVKNILANVSQL